MTRILQTGLFVLLALGLVSAEALAEPLKTRNVILVTLDGVRPVDFFGGLDETIAAHDALQEYSDIALERERFGGATPQARREALMPFFWHTLAPMGVVVGNAAYDNHMRVENAVAWSSPGYEEMLTGAPRAEVVDNTLQRYPHATVLQSVNDRLKPGFGKVAEIGSWDGFRTAAADRDDAFVMLGAYDAVPAPLSNPAMDELAALRPQVLGLWEDSSNTAVTWHLAKAYLLKNQPRLLWLAVGNTDDFAHADRYDRYLECLHLVDQLLADLWGTLQSLDAYRDATTLIITTDHGRGLTGDDWSEHDIAIPGSSDVWAAVIGPDTPDVGEVREAGTAVQGQIAATVAQFFGLDFREVDPEARAPLEGALGK